MGSFNVLCGLTKLSIHSGDKCVLIPLIFSKEWDDNKGEMCYNKTKTLHPTSMYLDPFSIWEPAFFPIMGTYNDYGSLEDIEKDENTEVIERKFGISIERFANLITDSRVNIYDSLSEYSDFLSNPKSLEYDYDFEKFLTELGFKVKGNKKVYKDICELTKKDDDYICLFYNEKIEKKYGIYDKEKLLSDIRDITGRALGISAENYQKYEEISKLSAMFVLEEAYDFYTVNKHDKDNTQYLEIPITQFLLETLGFTSFNGNYIKDGKTMFCLKKKNAYSEYYYLNDTTIYNVKQLLDNYQAVTGKELDCDIIKGLDTHDIYVMQLKAELPKKVTTGVFLEYNFTKDERLNTGNIEDIISYIKDKKYVLSLDCQLLFTDSWIFKEFTYLKDNYWLEIIRNYSLFNEFERMTRLLTSMYYSNIVFAPTFCGSQCGNTLAEMKLSYITNKIAENRKDQLDEEINELDIKNAL